MGLLGWAEHVFFWTQILIQLLKVYRVWALCSPSAFRPNKNRAPHIYKLVKWNPNLSHFLGFLKRGREREEPLQKFRVAAMGNLNMNQTREIFDFVSSIWHNNVFWSIDLCFGYENATARIKVHELRSKSKPELLAQLKDLKAELALLRVAKVTGGAPNKLSKMYTLFLFHISIYMLYSSVFDKISCCLCRLMDHFGVYAVFLDHFVVYPNSFCFCLSLC